MEQDTMTAAVLKAAEESERKILTRLVGGIAP